jgi:hypothetical protein
LLVGFVLFAYQVDVPYVPDNTPDNTPDDKPKPDNTPDDNVPPNPDRPTPPAPDRPVPPTPLPIPQVTAFGENVTQTYTRESGTANDAIVLAGLFKQMSKILVFDGQRATPKITTGQILGDVYREMQRYQASSESPWGTKYTQTQQLIGNELAMRVQAINQSVALDANKRQAAVNVFQEAGDGLEKFYVQAHNSQKHYEWRQELTQREYQQWRKNHQHQN